MSREQQHSHKASFWAGLWLGIIEAIIQNAWMEHSKSFKRSNTSKKDLIWQKPSIRGFHHESGEKGSGFKFSCFKISLKEKEKKKSHLTEAVYFRKHSDTDQLCFILEHWQKPAGARVGGQHTATGLTQHGHPGPRTCARMSRGAPTTVLCWRNGPEDVATHLLFWNQNPRWLL